MKENILRVKMINKREKGNKIEFFCQELRKRKIFFDIFGFDVREQKSKTDT